MTRHILFLKCDKLITGGSPWSGGLRIGLRRGRSAVRISARREINFWKSLALSENGWMDGCTCESCARVADSQDCLCECDREKTKRNSSLYNVIGDEAFRGPP